LSTVRTSLNADTRRRNDDPSRCGYLDLAGRIRDRPGARPDQGLGRGADALHTWAIDSDDQVDAPHSGWSDERGDGADLAATPPTPSTCGSGSTSPSSRTGRSRRSPGLVDERRPHLAPVVLGSGTPRFGTGARPVLVQGPVRPRRRRRI